MLKITFHTETYADALGLCDSIHRALNGNKDYEDGKTIVSFHNGESDSDEGFVILTVAGDVEENFEIEFKC